MIYKGKQCECHDPLMTTFDGLSCVCLDANSRFVDGVCECLSKDMIRNKEGLCQCPNSHRFSSLSCVPDQDTYFCERSSCKILFSSLIITIA
jgi:hypothetical protein